VPDVTFDVITIFPGFFGSILEHGLLKRALAAGRVSIRIHDLRDFTDDRHHVVDDRPFGGGPGMVLKPEPLFRAVEGLRAAPDSKVVLLSPQGRLFSQRVAEELAGKRQVILICGRYEGVDERVAAELANDEISVGDYVLAGGELPAAVLMETVTRLLPGVVGNEDSTRQDSFSMQEELGDGSAARDGLLDCPHYTRPVEFRGLRVPQVLLSGDHEEIRYWRRQQALARTWRRRPELLKDAPLTDEDLEMLEEAEPDARVTAKKSSGGPERSF
jgi:tRNA (guanine37-N1)-methyltransferase